MGFVPAPKAIDDIAKSQNNFKEKNENETAENGDLVAFDYNATIENKRNIEQIRNLQASIGTS